jgi:cation diffusion facilitator family transporter
MGRQGVRVTVIGLAVNVGLVTGKLICGFIGRSSALVADAVHSGSDVVATAIVLLGLRVASRPKDEDHPYGHGRVESIVAAIVGISMLAAAGLIMKEAAEKAVMRTASPPAMIALIAALLSVVVKEWLFRYTIGVGKRLNSPSIIANAWDHRSDAYSSIGVLGGIVGAKLGLPVLDPIAAGVVAVFIFKTAFDILKEAVHDLTDRALPQDMIRRIAEVARDVEGVLDVVEVKGRRMGSKIIADLRIMVVGFLSAKEAHDIARRVEEKLLVEIPYLVEVMVHVDVEEVLSEGTMREFEEGTKEILDRHRELFVEAHELDYHFSERGREIHFHLVVPEGTSFEDAHELSRHLEEEIKGEFPDSTVVIHMEPASERKG